MQTNTEIREIRPAQIFGIDESSSNYEVERISIERRGPYYQHTARKVFDYVLIYVTSGFGWFEQHKTRHRIEPDSVLFRDLSIPFYFETESESTFEFIRITIFGDHIKALFELYFGSSSGVLKLNNPQPIHEAFLDLYNTALNRHPLAHDYCNQSIPLLLVKIAISSQSTEPLAYSSNKDVFFRCKKYIEQNFTKIHTITEVSLACNLSNAYLCRLFKKHANMTPYNFMISLKIREAKNALAFTSSSIKEVSASLGFTDQYNFSKVFKSKVGASPKQYRESL